ncbi:transcriptional regulator NrdR [Proteiniclasticum sp. QWL-01]|uniref:transcriptional regulator NrdR n=1 Tax=Proteiniclasticum sp. QWL-01 TaxID=3036945 RepID=UPI0021FB5F52|nr:transcriptional regulator NrdR [Proteiniclasticum sp. QWL-01]UUM12959.1 transcriptional regulator NrdR [Clostridiaceae bacterium HFYG-1003]WFF71384.1 transcriptional regulator NrdR [Proteiniclasticum sp. QWL-01]
MKCPYCGYLESKVIDTRPTEDGSSIRRRRECLDCTRRYTTYEKVETLPILVIKKDESREPFDKNKIISGLVRATQKRPVSMQQMENLADDIERSISNKMISEVTTDEIGNMVMERLKTVDEVAYVRFASVYRQFKDISTFFEEIKSLMGKEMDPME